MSHIQSHDNYDRGEVHENPTESMKIQTSALYAIKWPELNLKSCLFRKR